MQTFVTEAVDWPDSAPALREQVRTLVAEHGERDPVKRANSWTKADPGFSRKLGEAGLLGMTWPEEYGGHERSQLERYVVIEELLAAGAPVGAHWIADRQSGPLLLRLGNEELRRRWVPAIARGEAFACIGLSEPGSGSDLASVHTSARRDGPGWVVNGQKVWTTGAHVSHFMIALVRSEAGSERQQGLSQFVIPMDTPGVTVKPIIDLTGAHEFNEVFFEDVRLPASALLGTEGEGWKQATAELSLERSGPERYLSSMVLFHELVRHAEGKDDPALMEMVGRLASEAWTLRLMSASVAAKLARGEDPALEATIVKDLGNSYEQAIPQLVQSAIDFDDADTEVLRAVCFYLLQVSPSFSLRGGTREIIRGIIARGLGLR
ncbi:acyl-CoA dehydrogenase family protein [Qipengyuania mesophila]|uniref:acyl-CoA dehydrogenase family protein n=1 Tax=Qipengyuania mesophila TaxID=2867246 RepID=UPI003512229F